MNLLVTVIFLLSSGAPATKASVTCDGLLGFVAGDDTRKAITEFELLLDKRGAAIMETKPKTITCFAAQDGEVWAGTIALTHGVRIVRVQLKGVTRGSAE
jgi:hypothetical protein